MLTKPNFHLRGPIRSIDPHQRPPPGLQVPRTPAYQDRRTYVAWTPPEPGYRGPAFDPRPVRKAAKRACHVDPHRGLFGKLVEYTNDPIDAGRDDSHEISVSYKW